MSDVTKELKRIEKVGAIAWTYLDRCEWRKARRELKKIKNSWAIFEVDRLQLEVESEIFARQGRYEETCLLYTSPSPRDRG